MRFKPSTRRALSIKGMYERTLNQVLVALRRIKCLTYGMFLITLTTLVLYLIRDVMTVQLISSQTMMPHVAPSRTRHAKAVVSQFEASTQGYNHPNCAPQNNIIFTKTHKTGSSTLTNILLRYGETHNKTQLLYKYPSSTEYKHLTEDKLLTGRSKANIFSQHATYNQNFLEDHIYKGYKTFTILRSPISQFISAYSFFGKTKVYPAETFEESILKFLTTHNHDRYLQDNYFCKNCGLLVNANAIDMGFMLDEYFTSADKEEYLERFFSKADATWDLVLITEYFDLSLVLLKRRLCLQMEDILYLKSLERIKKETVYEEHILEKIARLQYIDTALYNHFNATFWLEVEKEKGIFEELETFQRLNKKAQSFCVQESRAGYGGTYENVLSAEGRANFQCVAMNTRCLPFSRLLEARDDPAISDEQLDHVKDTYTNPDNLSFEQLVSMSRDSNILDYAKRQRI